MVPVTQVWKEVGSGPVFGFDWTPWLCSDKHHVDPYLLWADVTCFAGFGGLPGLGRSGGELPILLELTREGLEVPDRSGCPQAPTSGPPRQCPIDMGLFEISGAYLSRTTRTLTRYVTGRVPLCNVGELFRCGTSIVRFQMGLPRVPANQRTPERSATAGQADGDFRQVVVGIIDDGCPFAAPELADAVGDPRVFYLWDQDEKRKPGGCGGWKKPFAFAYGAELDRRTMSLAVAEAELLGGSPAAALAPYKAVHYVPVEPEPDDYTTSPPSGVPAGSMLVHRHGAAVTALAAGSLPPSGRLRENQGLVPEGRPDNAAAWPVVFVQLPSRTALDTSGGSLGVHVLDGIHYILQRALTIPYRVAAPQASSGPPQLSVREQPATGDEDSVRKFAANHVVINISYGAIAGPHDGTSILEQAMAEIAEFGAGDQRFVAFVLAAGNAAGGRTHAGSRSSTAAIRRASRGRSAWTTRTRRTSRSGCRTACATATRR
ncbi:MAG: hypothetical protein U1F67_13435 [Rubrivivax sp.]